MQPEPGHVQIRVRRLDVRVPEHLLHVVQRPPLLKQSGASLVTKIVEVQVDGLVRRPQLRNQPAALLPSSRVCPWAFRTAVCQDFLTDLTRCPTVSPNT